MRLHDAAKMPWLTIPFIGGIASLLPILFATKAMGDQYKDDIIETTYVRHDGSEYKTRRGSYAPGMILFMGLGVCFFAITAILNFLENLFEYPASVPFASITQFALVFGLIKQNKLIEYTNSIPNKEGFGWPFWVSLVLSLLWPFTPIAPLFEIPSHDLFYLYIPITVFVFLGLVIPLLASLQIFYLLMVTKTYWAFTIVAIWGVLAFFQEFSSDSSSATKALMPILILSFIAAATALTNLKIWQYTLSNRQEKSSILKVISFICGLITGLTVLIGGVLSVIFIKFYNWSGFNQLGIELADLSIQYDTIIIAYFPLAIAVLMLAISIITTKRNNTLSSKSKSIIIGASSVAIIPIIVFLTMSGIKASAYSDIIQSNIENDTASVFVNAYKAPDGISRSDKLSYTLALIEENLLSDNPLVITGGSVSSDLRQTSQQSEDNYTITIRGRKPAPQTIEQGFSLAKGKHVMTFQRGDKSVTDTITIRDRDIERGYKTDHIRIR